MTKYSQKIISAFSILILLGAFVLVICGMAYAETNGIDDANFYNPQENLENLTTKNETCIVTFDMQGHGNQIEQQEVESGQCAVDPQESQFIVASKYRFCGWYIDDKFTNKYSFSSPVEGNITLYAKWEKLSQDDLVTVYFDNSDNWEDVYIYMWGTVTSPDKNAGAWPGIKCDIAGPDICSFSVDKNIGLQKYIFNNKENGQQTEDLTFTGSDIISTPPYYTTSPGTDDRTVYFDNTDVKWSQVCIMKTKDVETKATEYDYMQKMNIDGRDIYKYTYAQDIPFPPTTKPRTCFQDAIDTKQATHIIKNINWSEGKHLLIPGLNEKATMCTVKFDTAGIVAAPGDVSVINGGYIEEISAPAVEGYTFNGWYKQSQYTEKWDFATDVVSGDTTLFAKYTKNDSPITPEPAVNPASDQEITSTSASTSDIDFMWAFVAVLIIGCSVSSFILSKRRSI